MTGRRGTFRVGTSGYQYAHWRGLFYPHDLPVAKWLAFYADRFDSVEINNTFYRLPETKTFDSWRESAPKGFLFALKFNRYGSHLKRLKTPRATIGRFVRRAEHLRDHLGPTLVQLPPRWRADPSRLEDFLAATPRSRRWALEFRDASWLEKRIYAVLRRYGAALCIHDLLDHHPREITTDWTYLRFHGDRYAGCYSPQALGHRAKWVRDWLDSGLDVYAYFNNDVGGHAVANAAELRRHVERR